MISRLWKKKFRFFIVIVYFLISRLFLIVIMYYICICLYFLFNLFYGEFIFSFLFFSFLPSFSFSGRPWGVDCEIGIDVLGVVCYFSLGFCKASSCTSGEGSSYFSSVLYGLRMLFFNYQAARRIFAKNKCLSLRVCYRFNFHWRKKYVCVVYNIWWLSSF